MAGSRFYLIKWSPGINQGANLGPGRFKEFDQIKTGSNIDFNNDDGTIRIKQKGLYKICVSFLVYNADGNTITYIYKNGKNVASILEHAGGKPREVSVFKLLELDVDDVINIHLASGNIWLHKDNSHLQVTGELLVYE